MKKTIKTNLFFVALLLTIVATTTQAQLSPSSQPRYKDMILENPDAEADIKVVSDFVNSVVSGDLDKAKSLLSANYKGHGPALTDSVTSEQTISAWKENYKMQSNRKVGFVAETFRVASGNLKGDWVAVWGDYSFTQGDKNLSFPFQYTARVANAKIDTDRIYYDRLSVLQTLGYTLTPPKMSK
jgi:predicted SnoaL-like aldol condensation-catalyzing enzyme